MADPSPYMEEETLDDLLCLAQLVNTVADRPEVETVEDFRNHMKVELSRYFLSRDKWEHFILEDNFH